MRLELLRLQVTRVAEHGDVLRVGDDGREFAPGECGAGGQVGGQVDGPHGHGEVPGVVDGVARRAVGAFAIV